MLPPRSGSRSTPGEGTWPTSSASWRRQLPVML